jgi:hypothetical protein
MAPPKPRTGNNKELKQSKKDSQYEKTEEKEEQANVKEGDRKSVSGANENGYDDSD